MYTDYNKFVCDERTASYDFVMGYQQMEAFHDGDRRGSARSTSRYVHVRCNCTVGTRSEHSDTKDEQIYHT